MKERIKEELIESSRLKLAVSEQLVEKIQQVATKIISALKNNNKVVLFGNGGSAADAQHIAGELVGRFLMEREPLPAIALTTNTSILTSIGNDYGFDEVFLRQVKAIVNKGDVAVGISTSGNAENVIKGIVCAKERGAYTVGMTGRDGGRLSHIVDICINVPSDKTPRIQECHITIGHILCGIVEEGLCQNTKR